MDMPDVRPAHLRIGDLKSSWNKGPKQEDVAYRPECFSCEHFRYNVFGGVVLEDEFGHKKVEEKYHCSLIHDKKQRCKFDEEEAEKDKGQEEKTVKSRLPVYKTSSRKTQSPSTSEDLSSERKLDKKHSAESESPLPNLPTVEAPSLRPRPPRRDEQEDPDLDLW